MAPSLTLFLLFSLRVLALTPDPSGASKVGNGQHQSSIGSQCLSSLDCGANGNTACCALLPQTGSETIGICSGCGATTQQGKQGCGFGDADKNLAGDAQICPASSFAGGVIPSASTAGGGQSAAPEVQAGSGGDGAAAGGSTTLVTSVTTAAAALSVPTPAAAAAAGTLPDPNLDAGKGNQQNQQFVTGACVNSKDCGASQADLSKVCCASVMSGGEVVGVCSGAAVGNAAPKMGCGFGDGKATSAA